MPVIGSGPAGSATGITVSDLIEATRRHLYGSHRPRLSVLATTLTTASTSVVLGEAVAQPGDYVGVGTEVIYHRSGTSTTLTVLRSQLGTTAQQHTSGTEVEAGARFPRGIILKALKDEIRSWPSHIYRPVTVDLSFAADTDAVDLTSATDVLHLLRVWYTNDTTVEQWPLLEGARVESRQNTSYFPSGYALVAPRYFDKATTVRVAYAAKFDLDTFTLATDIGDIGLTSDMADIPPLGAAATLMMAEESSRVALDSQGRTRNPEEVPVGSATRAGAFFRQRRDERLAEVHAGLLSEYGYGS